MSGVFYVGLGDRFDGEKVAAYPPGSVIVLPGDTYHFHWAKSGEYVTQVSAIGPLGLEYLDSGDDPRERAHERANRYRATYCNPCGIELSAIQGVTSHPTDSGPD